MTKQERVHRERPRETRAETERREAAAKEEREAVEHAQKCVPAKGRELKDDLDEILDEIDEVLEENAEAFIKSYVQKGGQ